MKSQKNKNRLATKTTLHTIQVELQTGYALSPVEAQVLARCVQQLVDAQSGFSRQPGQITYQAVAIDEPPGKPLKECRKVPVHLTIVADGDAQVWATKGPEALRRLRAHRVTFEAPMQGGALSQEDVACVLGVSRKTVQRIFAYFRRKGQPLPSRGEIRDIGRGVSHKVPIIRKYVRDLSFSRISRELGNHGISSMARYLHHFAMVMILEDRGLNPAQMQSVVGASENLIGQYRDLYTELNVPEHARTLERLKRTIIHPEVETEVTSDQPSVPPTVGKKGGLQ